MECGSTSVTRHHVAWKIDRNNPQSEYVHSQLKNNINNLNFYPALEDGTKLKKNMNFTLVFKLYYWTSLLQLITHYHITACIFLIFTFQDKLHVLTKRLTCIRATARESPIAICVFLVLICFSQSGKAVDCKKVVLAVSEEVVITSSPLQPNKLLSGSTSSQFNGVC